MRSSFCFNQRKVGRCREVTDAQFMHSSWGAAGVLRSSWTERKTDNRILKKVKLEQTFESRIAEAKRSWLLRTRLGAAITLKRC